MSQPAALLPDEQRDALTEELLARWEAAEPGTHKCFCGSDRDLIEAVERYRHEQDRERG
jgi:hypothetical protein